MAKQAAWPISPYAGITRTGSGGLRPLDGRPRDPWRTVDRRTLSLVGPSSRVSVRSDRLVGGGENAKAAGRCAAQRRSSGPAKDSYEFFRRVLTAIESGVRKTMVVGPVSYGGRP
ncbi:hypothetical protein GCM10009639_67440 [Kitasatospora putterlickiae]|uniref:Uncharacterized protein n=1 Tax=Kitasatospora putterlickiae TaxID=221725 RepID=A0ABN1YI74_9ACTN